MSVFECFAVFSSFLKLLLKHWRKRWITAIWFIYLSLPSPSRPHRALWPYLAYSRQGHQNLLQILTSITVLLFPQKLLNMLPTIILAHLTANTARSYLLWGIGPPRVKWRATVNMHLQILAKCKFEGSMNGNLENGPILSDDFWKILEFHSLNWILTAFSILLSLKRRNYTSVFASACAVKLPS